MLPNHHLEVSAFNVGGTALLAILCTLEAGFLLLGPLQLPMSVARVTFLATHLCDVTMWAGNRG